MRGQGLIGLKLYTVQMAKLSTKQFIAHARAVHGDKYDYSQVTYFNNTTKIRIICPEHGEFLQSPKSHKKGCGCFECGRLRTAAAGRLSTASFVNKAREVHGDKYDYSKVEYVNSSTKVTVVCPEGHSHAISPNRHLQGDGCGRCQRPTAQDAIERFRKAHGDKYDYSNVVYKGAKRHVTIICPEGHEFEQTPQHHWSGIGCKRCHDINNGLRRRGDTESFIERASQVHGTTFCYDKAEYTRLHNPVIITCAVHGDYEQPPSDHLSGHGCPNCANEGKGSYRKKDTEQFVAEAQAVHGDKYDYDDVEYLGSTEKVCIRCPTHGVFEQVAAMHLFRSGCPDCAEYGFNYSKLARLY